MGNKITKLILVVAIICTVILGLVVNAKPNENPQSPIIKVGIMDNGFRTLERGSVSLYSTETGYICEPDTRKTVAKIPAYQAVTFSIKNGVISFKVPNEDTYFESPKGYVLACPDGVLGVKELKRAGKQALYRGALKVQKNTKPDILYLINIIELEDYLKGVVSNEMPVSFGLEALKAQAVAARNYAIMPRTKVSKAYDVVDSVASQVYFGYNTESETGNRAVKETEGIIAIYNHKPILALYSSCAGGYTENYSYAFSDPDTKQFPAPMKPYLIAKPDLKGICPLNREDAAYLFYSTTPESYDVKSRYYRWQRVWTREELEKVLAQNLVKQSKTGFVTPEFHDNTKFGSLKSLKVVRRGNSGKIIYLDIITTEGKYRVAKELVIRRLFTKNGSALPSANVVFKCDTDSFDEITQITAYGGGFGHGVGMSQYGASFMAKELKKNFIEILKHYYTGIYLGTKPVDVDNKPVQQIFYPPSDKALIEIQDRKNLSNLQVNINGKTCNFDLSKYMNIQRCELDISSYIHKGKTNTIIYVPACQNKLVTNDLSKGNIKINLYIKFL